MRSDVSDLRESQKLEIPSTQPTEDKTQLTVDDIETFYEVIAKGSYDKQETYAGTLALVRKNYYLYVVHHLRKSADFPEVKKRALIDQIKMLKEKSFFTGKIDLKIVDLIINDIVSNGKDLLAQVAEKQCDDFGKVLQDINDRCTSSAPTEKTYPDKIRSGLSFSERRELSYGPSYQISSLSSQINSEGLEHYHKKEWEEAIKSFEGAIFTETSLASESKMEKDDDFIAIYQRNIALAYNNWGVELSEKKECKNAVEKFERAIEFLKRIQFKDSTREDRKSLSNFQRNLSLELHKLGVEYYNKKLYPEAIKLFQRAIAEHYKIDSQFKSKTDLSNLSVFQRNLAYAFNELGKIESDEHKEEAAIEHIKTAISLFQKVSKHNYSDNEYFSKCNRNLAYAYNKRGNIFFEHNNFVKAKENYLAAIAASDQIIEQFFKSSDFDAQEIYNLNLENTLERLEPQPKYADDIAMFFNQHHQKHAMQKVKSEPFFNKSIRKRKREEDSPDFMQFVRESKGGRSFVN